MNSYFTYTISTLTVLVACSTFVTAYSQMKIASAKVKLDLYERRFNVYISALNCYQACYNGQPKEMIKFQCELIEVCRESKFLFKEDSNIYSILDTMKAHSDNIINYKSYIKKYEGTDPLYLEEYHKDLREVRAMSEFAINDFLKNLVDLEVQIKPYIQFENVKGWTFF